MQELHELKEALNPTEILFVADAMTGQDAVRSADEFHKRLGITGVILTKMDGDARGGAALSIRSITGQPLKFVGTGEKTDALEPFHPDRLASRILGMGDVLSLVEKAQSVVDQEQAQEMVGKLREDSFSLEDFRSQLRQVRQVGPLDQIMGMRASGTDTLVPHDGKFIEVNGHNNRATDPPAVVIDREKEAKWTSKGAQPSNTVKKLTARAPKPVA